MAEGQFEYTYKLEQEVLAWLQTNRLMKIKDVFEKEQVSMEDLKTMDAKYIEGWMDDLGITQALQRNRFKQAINKLNNVNKPAPTSTSKIIHIVMSQQEQESWTKLDKKTEEISTNILQIENEIKKLKDIYQKQNKKIDDNFEAVIQEINKKRSKLKQNLKNVVTQKQCILKQQIETLSLCRNNLMQCKNEHDHMLKNNLNMLDRKGKAVKLINQCLGNNQCNIDGKGNINVQLIWNKEEIYQFINKKMGVINSLTVPLRPTISINEIKTNSVTISAKMKESDMKDEERVLVTRFRVKVATKESVMDEDEKKGDNIMEKEFAVQNKSESISNVSVGGLLKNNEYIIAVKGNNKYGWGSWSEAVAFRTKNMPLLRWSEEWNHGDGVSFLNEHKTKVKIFPKTRNQSVCCTDFVIDKAKCNVFKWKIIVPKMDYETYIGFVDYKNIQSFKKNGPQNKYPTYCVYAYSPQVSTLKIWFNNSQINKISVNTQVTNGCKIVLEFEANMKTKDCKVWFHGQDLGVVFSNIPDTIVPAVCSFRSYNNDYEIILIHCN